MTTPEPTTTAVPVVEPVAAPEPAPPAVVAESPAAAPAPVEPADPPAAEPAPPAEHVIEGEPITESTDASTDEGGEEAEPEPEKWEHEPDWPHDELEFHGDILAVKIPSKGMINALFHAGTTSPEFQYKLVSKFESIHISDASRERVISRMADENDPEYTTGEEWEELTNKLNELGAERVRKDNEALAAVKG